MDKYYTYKIIGNMNNNNNNNKYFYTINECWNYIYDYETLFNGDILQIIEVECCIKNAQNIREDKVIQSYEIRDSKMISVL